MEKQETEMKQKLEMEIRNRNGNKKTHQSLVLCFFIVCLLLYYRTHSVSHVLCLYSCTVLCDCCLLQSSLVHM